MAVHTSALPDDLIDKLRDRVATGRRDAVDAVQPTTSASSRGQSADEAVESLAEQLTVDEKLSIAAWGRRRSPNARLDPAVVTRISRGGRA